VHLHQIPESQYVNAIKHLWLTKKELDSFPKGQPIDILLFDRNWEENGFWNLPIGPHSPLVAFRKSTYTPISNTHGILKYHGELYNESDELEFMMDNKYHWGPISYIQQNYNISPHDDSFVGFRGPFVLYTHLQQLPYIIREPVDDDNEDVNYNIINHHIYESDDE
jgi:hypothetical protein